MLFPGDRDGNHCLFFTMDLFSNWVETCAMPLLHSWGATEFLYNDMVTCWGSPCYVWIDNSTNFVDSFVQLY